MSTNNEERDLLTRSRDFRRNMLTPSGGWLHDVVVGASTVTGLSDFFLLGIIFVGSWCILRLSEREIALILGLGFDLTIPLQHSSNSRVKERHRQHMEQYWPVFLTGMAIEFACLLFVHPAMFTLVVCLKTTVCTTMWFVHGPEAGAGVASTTKPKENKPVQVAPAAEVKSETSTPKKGQDTSEKPKRTKEDAVVEKLAGHLQTNGFKSATACIAMAKKILQQTDQEAIKASVKELTEMNAEDKQKFEMEVKAKNQKQT